MRWQIEPLLGLGPLKLGMTRAEVGAILDPIAKVAGFYDAYGGGKQEFRALGLPMVFYKDGAVTGFDTHARMKDLYLDEFQIYEHPSRQVLQFLEHKNGGGALAGLGYVLFDRLGINTGGFYSEKENSFFEIRSGEQDDRVLSINRRGDFDAFRHLFHPITFEHG